ncbi:hypothetical protein D3C81_1242640 [compost metagenome]
MAQGCGGIASAWQNDLCIAQVKQAFLAGTLEHVLGQRQMTPPGRNASLQLACLMPAQVTHGYLRQVRQLLDHQRVRGNAATEACPRLGVGGSVDHLPTALTQNLNMIEHHLRTTSALTCGSCQKASRTA